MTEKQIEDVRNSQITAGIFHLSILNLHIDLSAILASDFSFDVLLLRVRHENGTFGIKRHILSCDSLPLRFTQVWGGHPKYFHVRVTHFVELSDKDEKKSLKVN